MACEACGFTKPLEKSSSVFGMTAVRVKSVLGVHVYAMFKSKGLRQLPNDALYAMLESTVALARFIREHFILPIDLEKRPDRLGSHPKHTSGWELYAS